MSDSLSARPPRNRDRFAALSDPEAKKFIDAAPDAVAAREPEQPMPHAEAAAAGEGEGGAQGELVPAVTQPANIAVIPQTTAPASETGWKSYPLRVRPSVHDQLKYIAENSPRSINDFVNDALAPAIEKEIARINKIKELGLG